MKNLKRLYRIAIKILKLPFVIGIRLFFTVRQIYPVWINLINRNARNKFRSNVPVLDPVQRRVANELKERGIAVTSLDEFFPGKNLLPILQKQAQESRDRAEVKTGKTFLQYLWDLQPELNFQDPFIKISLSDRTLDVVNSYMGMYSRFFALTLNITMPSDDATAFASQKWHRDPEDKRMCKIFIYLNDVDDGSGPFIYIPESNYGNKWGGLFKQLPPRGRYPEKGAVEKIVPLAEIKKCTGNAGTMIFADTSGLHKGGYATKSERIMYTGGFRSGSSAWDSDFKHPQNMADKMSQAGLSNKACYAVQFNSLPFSRALLYWLKKN